MAARVWGRELELLIGANILSLVLCEDALGRLAALAPPVRVALLDEVHPPLAHRLAHVEHVRPEEEHAEQAEDHLPHEAPRHVRQQDADEDEDDGC